MTASEPMFAPERRRSGGAITIDVHHHFNPTLKDNEGNPWSIAMAIEEMDRNAVPVAIASLGPVNDAASEGRPRRVREWNEWGANVCRDHPTRFGLFASLPLPHVDLALAEIAYACDILEVDGIALSTNDGDVWLSDERNAPVLAELDRREAVVFVHPAPTSRCSALSCAYGGPAISAPWLEFPVNTARAILGLLAQGVTQNHPRIRFIFSHGGGVMPLILGRVAGFSGWRTVGPATLEAMFPHGIHSEFAKLYFDCAQAYSPETIALLRTIVPTSRLLFGSDFSYFPLRHSVEEFEALGLDHATADAIGGGNAAELFPRFRTAEPAKADAESARRLAPAR